MESKKEAYECQNRLERTQNHTPKPMQQKDNKREKISILKHKPYIQAHLVRLMSLTKEKISFLEFFIKYLACYCCAVKGNSTEYC